MNIALSKILRRLLDSALESMTSQSDLALTPEERDLLEKRFFEVSDSMDHVIADACLASPPLTALIITEELEQQLEQIDMDLFSQMDRDFLERVLRPLEVELNDVKGRFRAAMIRFFAEADALETPRSTPPLSVEQKPRGSAANISLFSELLNLMIQLLTDLEQDTSLDWSRMHSVHLDQRLFDIHDNLKHHFVRGGILPPSDAATRLSDRLFHELGELMSELTNACDDWWTPSHRQRLCESLRVLHRQFDDVLDHAVDNVWQHQAAVLPSDIMHHIVTTLTDCQHLLSHSTHPHSEGTRAHRQLSSLLRQLTNTGESL